MKKFGIMHFQNGFTDITYKSGKEVHEIMVKMFILLSKQDFSTMFEKTLMLEILNQHGMI